MISEIIEYYEHYLKYNEMQKTTNIHVMLVLQIAHTIRSAVAFNTSPSVLTQTLPFEINNLKAEIKEEKNIELELRRKMIKDLRTLSYHFR